MKIGLVLSGGVAKGAYQAGFLKAIEEIVGRDNISCVSGASIGMLNAYMFCKNKTNDLIDLWKNIHFDSMSDLIVSTWFKKYINKVINSVVNETDFLDIPIYSPICYLPFFQLNYGKLYGEYSKKWNSFLKGGISFPIISGGIRFFRGQFALDGGVVDNIPLCPLSVHEKPDIIIVLHFVSRYRPRKEFVDTGIPIIDFDISLNSKYKNQTFDFHTNTLNAMIDDGYNYGKQICQELFEKGCYIKSVLEQAEIIKNRELPLREKGKELDSWTYKLNKVMYAFLKRDKFKILNLEKKKFKTKTKKSNKRIEKNVFEEMS